MSDEPREEYRARELSALRSGEQTPDVCLCKSCCDLRDRIAATSDEPRERHSGLNPDGTCPVCEAERRDERGRFKSVASDEPRRPRCKVCGGTGIQEFSHGRTDTCLHCPPASDEPRHWEACGTYIGGECTCPSDEPREKFCVHCDTWVSPEHKCNLLRNGETSAQRLDRVLAMPPLPLISDELHPVLAAILAEVAQLQPDAALLTGSYESAIHDAAIEIQRAVRLHKEGVT